MKCDSCSSFLGEVVCIDDVLWIDLPSGAEWRRNGINEKRGTVRRGMATLCEECHRTLSGFGIIRSKSLQDAISTIRNERMRSIMGLNGKHKI